MEGVPRYSPPIKRKPTLPLPFPITQQVPNAPTLIDSIQTVLSMASDPQTSEAELRSYLSAAAWAHVRGGPSDFLLVAIDPSTGDSVLHRAAAAANISLLACILRIFGPNLGKQPERERQLWVFVTHQNMAGDTALHAAARRGSVRSVKAVYRVLHAFDCADVDESLRDDEEAREEEAKREGFTIDMPVEFVDFTTEEMMSVKEDDMDTRLAALSFVCEKNREGRDAAGEVREGGWEELAGWLEDLGRRLDREGKRGDEEYLRWARGMVLKRYWYFEDREGEVSG